MPRPAGRSQKKHGTNVMNGIRICAAALAAAGVIATAAPASAAVVPAHDRAVTFVVDGTTTYGTVHVPAHRAGQHLAAALLLPGSGSTDRNGDTPAASLTPHTLALISGVLVDDGIMSLRFDKYFTGQTGGGPYASDPGSFTLQAQIRQNDAAYHALRTQPEADPSALLILGHSEGGLTGMLTAESVHPAPAGLALLAPADLRMLDAIRLQTDELVDAYLKAGAIDTAISDYRAGRPVPDPSDLIAPVATAFASVFSPNNAGFVRSEDPIYPPTVAAHLPEHPRVLLTCGAADTNIPCPTIPPVAHGLARAGTTGPGLRVLPNIDHELHTAGTPPNTQTLAPAVVAALNSFAQPWTRTAAAR